MQIKSIEPTPSPNTMKVILDEELPMGSSHNYKKEMADGAPTVIGKILSIPGVKGVYHVADFLAVERNAKYDWKELLPQVRNAFGEIIGHEAETSIKFDEHFGEINVQIQMFKGIPLQVKLSDGTEEKRFGLPERYTALVSQLLDGENYIYQRKWQDYGVRYGEWNEVGTEVVEELLAAYPEERLNELVKVAKNAPSEWGKEFRTRHVVTLEDLDENDWRKRYQVLEQMPDPTIEDLDLLNKALHDEKPSIRRLATVYLGMIEDKAVLPSLYLALRDKSVTVRRTAGDCLSDLGFKEAQQEMMKALFDKSKLVRWRAAMFLYEVGDEEALEALQQAEDDSEFEVSMQIKLAIERIQQGEEAKGSVWKQMTESRKNK